MQPAASDLTTPRGLSVGSQIALVVFWLAAVGGLAVVRPSAASINVTELTETEACGQNIEPAQELAVGAFWLQTLASRRSATFVVFGRQHCLRRNRMVTLIVLDPQSGGQPQRREQVLVSGIHRTGFYGLGVWQQKNVMRRVKGRPARLAGMEFTVVRVKPVTPVER